MINKVAEIKAYLDRLPYFEIDNLKIFGAAPAYLRILLSRLETRGAIVRMKRGVYAAKAYCDKMKSAGKWPVYLEFLASKIYSPAYLSLDYVLYAHNILTEAPVNFTLISAGKTAFYKNALGAFSYHKIKAPLFCGYAVSKEGEFPVYKASKAKALFDFLYLRRDLLREKKAFLELRLNPGHLGEKDLAEFKKYMLLSKSKRMSGLYGLAAENV